MNENVLITRNPGWLGASLGDEFVMMNAGSCVYLHLTGTGERIWQLLEQPRRLGALCGTLSSEYDGAAATVRSEVMQFLEELRKHDAIRIELAAA